MEVGLVGRAVAEEGDRHVALALRRERRARRRGDRSADDSEAADQAVLEVDHVHRSRPAAADPTRRSAEHLSRERLGISVLSRARAVAAVGPCDRVVRLERRADADGDGLLPRGQMRRPVHLALQEQALDLVLEQADREHPTQVFRGRLKPAGLIPWARSVCVPPSTHIVRSNRSVND